MNLDILDEASQIDLYCEAGDEPIGVEQTIEKTEYEAPKDNKNNSVTEETQGELKAC